jgi:hypothetical protein
MGAAQGKKVRRSSCGKAFEAQPSSGQTAMNEVTGVARPMDLEPANAHFDRRRKTKE